ncbi:MAG: hypothetical protein AB7S26_20855 [Sandaracinaceae bacterium]
MADTEKAPFWRNNRLLGIVGLLLLFMGFGTYGLVSIAETPDMQTVQLAAGVGVLMSLAVSTLLVAAIGRLEARVKELEDRAAKS